MPALTTTCLSCRFYMHVGVNGTADGRDGYCRRFPPVPVAFVRPGGSVAFDSRWATVNHHSWCGEFEAAEAK